MTNAELIQAIRAEIERRLDKHWEGLPNADSPEDDWTHNELCKLGAYKELEHLEYFLDTLEESKKCDGCNNVKGCVTCVNGDQWAHYEKSEKPMNQDELEDEMDRFFETMPVLEHENIFEDTFKNIARHFAQWGAKNAK